MSGCSNDGCSTSSPTVISRRVLGSPAWQLCATAQVARARRSKPRGQRLAATSAARGFAGHPFPRFAPAARRMTIRIRRCRSTNRVRLRAAIPVPIGKPGWIYARRSNHRLPWRTRRSIDLIASAGSVPRGSLANRANRAIQCRSRIAVFSVPVFAECTINLRVASSTDEQQSGVVGRAKRPKPRWPGTRMNSGNAESASGRFRTFCQTTMPVVALCAAGRIECSVRCSRCSDRCSD